MASKRQLQAQLEGQSMAFVPRMRAPVQSILEYPWQATLFLLSQAVQIVELTGQHYKNQQRLP